MKKNWSLAGYFNTVLLVIFGICTCLGAVWETTTFVTNTKEIKSNAEKTIARLFVASIREPIIQGAFIEAIAQSKRLMASDPSVCVSLRISDQQLMDCDAWSKGRKTISQQNEVVFFDDLKTQAAGNFGLHFDDGDIVAKAQRRFYGILIAGLAFALLVWALIRFFANTIFSEVRSLIDWRGRRPADQRFKISEFTQIAKELKSNIQTVLESEHIKSVQRINMQIAHDIRSPLSALKILEARISNISTDHRQLLRSAIERIREMADHLLEKSVATVISIDSEVLTDLIRSTIEVKKLEHGGLGGLQIKIWQGEVREGGKIRLNPSELGRILSNLVNNAVEAVDGVGIISVGVKHVPHRISITISDDGKGIPAHLIKRLGQDHVSFGKENGHGLGLSHAKATVESWGGTLELRSSEGVGTDVIVGLPLS